MNQDITERIIKIVSCVEQEALSLSILHIIEQGKIIVFGSECQSALETVAPLMGVLHSVLPPRRAPQRW